MNCMFQIEFHEQPQDQNAPWLTVGGKGILETHDCIKHLNEYYEIELEKDSPSSRLTASRMVNHILETRINWYV